MTAQQRTKGVIEMSADRIAFALWNASVSESDLLVVCTCGGVVELQLRGGNASLRSIVLHRMKA
jgi:hypothetical protein